jgi:hypothetical protein
VEIVDLRHQYYNLSSDGCISSLKPTDNIHSHAKHNYLRQDNKNETQKHKTERSLQCVLAVFNSYSTG